MEKVTTLLRSVREVRSQGKRLPPKLERPDRWMKPQDMFQDSVEHGFFCLGTESIQQEAEWQVRETFISIGGLWEIQAGRQGGCRPENLVGYIFIIKGKVGRGRRLPSSSFFRSSIINSSYTLGGGVFDFIWSNRDGHGAVEISKTQ